MSAEEAYQRGLHEAADFCAWTGFYDPRTVEKMRVGVFELACWIPAKEKFIEWERRK